MLLAGQTEYAVRFLSVISGVLIVALLYALGRRLFGHTAGTFAALAAAVSPLLVYYSQETRMYADVTLFGLLSTYVLVRATEPSAVSGQRSAWCAYFAAVAACLYSQYIGALVLAFQGFWVLLVRRKAVRPFAISAGAAVMAFGPWLALAKDSLLGWPSTNAFHAGPGLFGDAAFRYVEGLSADVDPLTIGFTAAVALLALAGLARGKELGVLPFLYIAVPLLAMFLLGLRRPVYNPKFALLALPGFLLLLGAGIQSLGRLRWAGLALVLAAAGWSLAGYYADARFARDDYRAIAHFIATSGRPGDAIILDAPGQEQIFPYYYTGALPWVGLPEERPPNPDKTSAELQRLNDQYKRLWLVLYGTNGGDPDDYVEHWLASKDFEIQNQWFGDARLAAFAVPSKDPPASRPADATFGSFARVTDYTLTPPRVASGDVLQLGLKWQATGQAPGNLKVFTHVIDAAGNIWAQRDSDPAGGGRPTSAWRPGETIDDNYGLLILPGTPPGQYQTEVGMYDPASPAKRQPVTAGGSGDRLLLGPVEVTRAEQPPSLDELRIPHPLDWRFALFGRAGPVRLLGYGLTLVGQDKEQNTFGAGDEIHLTLFWQADDKPTDDREMLVRFRARDGADWFADTESFITPTHRTSAWQSGDRYRDQRRFALPKGMTGDFDVFIYVSDLDPVSLTRVRIR